MHITHQQICVTFFIIPSASFLDCPLVHLLTRGQGQTAVNVFRTLLGYNFIYNVYGCTVSADERMMGLQL